MTESRPQAVPEEWDTAPGQKFAAEVAARIGTQVHYPKSTSTGSFYMLAVFRRYTFRLEEDMVSQALFSVLGGSPTCFHVHRESERQFRFSVASKAVGFMVHDLRRVITRHFDVYFHLWRCGGADRMGEGGGRTVDKGQEQERKEKREESFICKPDQTELAIHEVQAGNAEHADSARCFRLFSLPAYNFVFLKLWSHGVSRCTLSNFKLSQEPAGSTIGAETPLDGNPVDARFVARG